MEIYLKIKNGIRTKAIIGEDDAAFYQKNVNNPSKHWKKVKFTPEMLAEMVHILKEKFCEQCPKNFKHYSKIYDAKKSENLRLKDE